MKITLKNVRLAFPELFEPQTVNGEGEPAFSAAFILKPDDPQLKALRDAVDKVGKDKWASKWPGVQKELAAKDRFPYHDGDMKQNYSGFAGMAYVTARSKTRPGVYDRDKTPLRPDDGRPYAGCYVNAVIELWAQDNNYGKRINASLSGVQFVKDGEAFSGGRPASPDDFPDLGVEDENLEDVLG